MKDRVYYSEEKNKISRAHGYPDYKSAVTGMYDKMISMNNIASVFGVTQPAIAANLKKYGITSRSRGFANYQVIPEHIHREICSRDLTEDEKCEFASMCLCKLSAVRQVYNLNKRKYPKRKESS